MMADFTNPTGTVVGTDGDDTITFNTAPAATANVDASGGNDTLVVQFDYPTAFGFDASDGANSGPYQVYIQGDPTQPRIIVSNVENLEFHGGQYDDSFSLSISAN